MGLRVSAIFNGTYESKKVLITGHTGFKGSWLSVWLGMLGARVIGYALPPPTEPSIYEVLRLNNQLINIEGDVRDNQHLEQVITEYQPDMVFHLAAQPIVRLSYELPRYTYETNIMGTVNLLEAIRHAGSVRACLVVTSDKCYENQEWTYAYRENDPLGGYDPYSSSKAGAELVAGCYQRSFFNPGQYAEHRVALATARAGNVIGGGDWAADRIIPDIVRALSAGLPVAVRNPQSVRPWQHVLDPLAGYLWLAARMWDEGSCYSSAWNFGPDNLDNLTVGQLTNNMVKMWGSGEWQADSNNNPQLHEANYLKLDCTKAKALLDWAPVYDTDEAIKKTAEWYKAYYLDPKSDLYSLTREQIEFYMRQAQALGLRWAGEVGGNER
jgi:CDP-glucose 4,6-dehydratase